MIDLKEHALESRTILFDPWRDAEPLPLERYAQIVADVANSETVDPRSEGGRRLWWRYNWVRAFAFMEAVHRDTAAATESTRASMAPQIRGAEQLPTLSARRSCRHFKKVAVPDEQIKSVLLAAQSVLLSSSHLRLYLIVEKIEGLAEGVYRISADHGFECITATLDRRLLLRAAQGQWWAVSGGGGAFLLGVDWIALRQTHGDGPSAYMELLLELGRFGHHLLIDLCQSGLGAWMTPAIDETEAGKLVGITEPRHEVLYLLKFGMPKEDA